MKNRKTKLSLLITVHVLFICDGIYGVVNEPMWVFKIWSIFTYFCMNGLMYYYITRKYMKGSQKSGQKTTGF